MAFFDFLSFLRRGRALRELPLSRLDSSQDAQRKRFDEEKTAELAASIASCGLLRPLIVRKKGARYEVISGERRLRALKMLGKRRASCLVYAETGMDGALMAAIEHIQREQPDIFELAGTCLRLMNRLHLSAKELGRLMGKDESYIRRSLRLLQLEPSVRERIIAGGLSRAQAEAALLLRSTAGRLALVNAAKARELNDADTELLAKKLLEKEKNGAELGEKNALSLLDEAARVRRSAGGGERVGERPPQARRGRVIVRLMKDYRAFLNTLDIACDQLRSGGLRVDMDRSDREDGLDILICVTAGKGARGGAGCLAGVNGVNGVNGINGVNGVNRITGKAVNNAENGRENAV